MTSKHCFFRIGKQNMRHSSWLWALSFLGNLMALPVVMLLAIGKTVKNEDSIKRLAVQLEYIYDTAAFDMLSFVAIVAAVGALIVGMTNFRYLFHKNMVDTYHSIPVKRQTLFFANWLNGFVIWFVPFVLNLILTMVIAGTKVSSILNRIQVLQRVAGNVRIDKISENVLEQLSEYTLGRLIGGMLVDALLVTVVFLLIYHLTIVAMMVCGNALNALIVEGILGGGVMAAYGLLLGLCEVFMDTMITDVVRIHRGLQYASPFVSSVTMMITRGCSYNNTDVLGWGSWWSNLIVNGVIALLLLGLAAFLYQKRPSELAEQGLRNRWFKYPLQILASVIAGICGWWIFYSVSSTTNDSYNTIWGCFGILVGTVIAFGVLSVVNNMDFKAFFRDKLMMALTLVGTVLLCLSIRLDWYGFDTYLPEQDEIAEIAVFHRNYYSDTRRYVSIGDADNPLETMHITDAELAYALLHGCTETERAFDLDLPHPETEQIYVKVTKKNGRSYYRNYRICSTYEAELSEILSMPEYVRNCYSLPENLLVNAKFLRIESRVFRELSVRVDREWEEEYYTSLAEQLQEAYQRDIELHPEALTTQTGSLLCGISLRSEKDKYYDIEITENMTAVLAVLRRFGFEKATSGVAPKEVDRILIPVLYTVEPPEEDLPATGEAETEIATGSKFVSEEDPKVQEKLANGSWVYSKRIGYCAVVDDYESIRSILEGADLDYGYPYYLFGGSEKYDIYLECPGYEQVNAYVNLEKLPESVRNNIYFQ